jgi:hypothetical protein
VSPGEPPEERSPTIRWNRNRTAANKFAVPEAEQSSNLRLSERGRTARRRVNACMTYSVNRLHRRRPNIAGRTRGRHPGSDANVAAETDEGEAHKRADLAKDGGDCQNRMWEERSLRGQGLQDRSVSMATLSMQEARGQPPKRTGP